MYTLTIVGLIFLVSLILGLIKYGSLGSSYKNSSWQLKFVEIWNDFVNFLVSGFIGYYFIVVRWPQLLNNGVLNISDIFLLIFFLFGLFGHLCVLSKNFTDGIKQLIDKYVKG